MKTTLGAEEQRVVSVYDLVPVPVPVPVGRMGRIGRSTHYLVGEELLYTPSGKEDFWSLLLILEIAELALTFICTQIFGYSQEVPEVRVSITRPWEEGSNTRCASVDGFW